MLTPIQTRQILEELGHSPRHRLGQNFLIDGNIVKKSLELGQVQSKDVIVEVGPGLGTLTEAILAQGAVVYAVELDTKLATYLKNELQPKYPDAFFIMEGDALQYPCAGLPNTISSFKIIANLPYAISTPWLDAVLESAVLPEKMVLMLQREAADRFAGKTNTKKFGPISIFLQSAYTIKPGHAVSSGCFFPKPDVGSYLFNMERKEMPYRFEPLTKSIIRFFFTQRRKQLGSLLKNNFPELQPLFQQWIQSLLKAGIDEKARPEDTPISAWQNLNNLLKSKVI